MKKKIKLLIINCLCFFITINVVSAQSKKRTFLHADSLRGTLSDLRTCYDVTCYDLNLRVEPATKFLKGYNQISFKTLKEFNRLQLDLFENMNIDSIVWEKQHLQFKRKADAVFVRFPEKLQSQKQTSIKVYYNGQPRRAANAPWDGGFVWQKDEQGNDWIGVACEGLGASVWFPCKDHLSDEPDSTFIRCEVPSELMCVANGKLLKSKAITDTTTRYEWRVSYPINNYNITLNIGRYAHLFDTFRTAQNNILALNYYVLRANADKAKLHFAGQVKPMLKVFEKYFGEYPFLRDGYALVETPYWGMEHQSAIAYGNKYKNNEWGFDFIIVHESGHEYWGNSLSCADHAEMWIHESFCTYAEAIYMEERFGKEKAIAYLKQQRKRIGNKEPMLAPLGVNYNEWPDSDNYFKGTWFLHTLRHALNNDKVWFEFLLGLNQEFLRSTVNTSQIVSYFNKKTGKKWDAIFAQYLQHAKLPILEYKLEQTDGQWRVAYRWQTDEANFDMPISLAFGDNLAWKRRTPTTHWKYENLSHAPSSKTILNVNADEFYVERKEVK